MSEQETDKIMMLFADELLEDLLQTPDEELIRESEECFGSAEIEITDIRNEIDAAINKPGKDRLAQARVAVVEMKGEKRTDNFDASGVQQRVAEILASRTGLTLAARNGRALSEREIISAFSDLCELQGSTLNAAVYNFGSLPKAEQILQNLGVTEPNEIDVEAIAWHLGAKVRYEPLDHCEARIVGAGDAAIITVNRRMSRQRQRFSICHELGHWICHRRKMLLCQADDIERPSADSANLERVADRFAAELLMPSYLFAPIAGSFGRPTMSNVKKLAALFDTSQTAAAIRLIETHEYPSLLASYGKSGRRWFARSRTVDRTWMPNNDLAADSSTFNLVYGKGRQAMPPKSVDGSKWFSRGGASRFEIVEESLQVTSGEVLTLLSFKDARDFMRQAERQ